MHGISEVHIFHDKLYFGSPYNNYIGRTEYPGKRLVQKVNIKAPEQPPPTPKATQSPKPTTQPPTPKPTEKVTTQAPKKQESTPKPTEAPKPAKKNDDLKKPTVAPATQKPVESEKKAQQKENKVPKNNVDGEKLKAEKKPKQKENMAPKPIVEEIPSDTKAPKEESLKVIKKEGPMEMPHPDTKKQKNAVPKNAQP